MYPEDGATAVLFPEDDPLPPVWAGCADEWTVSGPLFPAVDAAGNLVLETNVDDGNRMPGAFPLLEAKDRVPTVLYCSVWAVGAPVWELDPAPLA